MAVRIGKTDDPEDEGRVTRKIGEEAVDNASKPDDSAEETPKPRITSRWKSHDE